MALVSTLLVTLMASLAGCHAIPMQNTVSYENHATDSVPITTTVTQPPTSSIDMCGKGQECDCDRIEDKNGDEYVPVLSINGYQTDDYAQVLPLRDQLGL